MSPETTRAREEALPGPVPVSSLDSEARAAFLIRTYLHLFGAIVAFTILEALFLATGLALPIAGALLGTSWLLVLGGFVVVSWLASHAAHAAESLTAQYSALGLFVVAQLSAPGVIESAALVTLLSFGLLTAVTVWSRQDLSFLGGILRWAFVMALALIVAGAVFGFQLGTYFSVAMIGLAGAAIIYDTSKVMHHYPDDRYVAASLELFASVALMFWYVLRLFLSRDE